MIAAAINCTLSLMHYPWMKQGTHGWHMRPDVVIRTGIIEPFWTRVVSPVDVARHTIDPFIESVRPRGAAVAPGPSPEKVAAAAVKVAQQFEKGRSVIVRVGDEKIRVSPTSPPPRGGGVWGMIVRAAKGLVQGKSVGVRVGPQRVLIRAQQKNGRQTRTIERMPISAPQPPMRPATAPRATQVLVRPTPMPVVRDQRRPPLPMTVPGVQVTTTPGRIPYGPVVKHPFHAYGRNMRRQTYAERPSERVTVQARMARQWAPTAIQRTRVVSRRPIVKAKKQMQPAAKTFDVKSRDVNQMAYRIASRYQ